MKRALPWLAGLAAATVAAGYWIIGYAATPQDAQKAIGYLMIIGVASVLGVSVGMGVRALRFIREGDRRAGAVLLAPALTGGLLVSAVVMQPGPQERAATLTDPTRLRAMAHEAADRGDTALLERLLQNPHTPANVRKKLARHPDARIRTLAAGEAESPTR